MISISTALIASGYTNIMNYIQVLFSVFNVPLFATFIIGMFWKRMTPAAGFWGMVAGSIGALGTYLLYKAGVLDFGSDLAEAFWGAIIAFLLDAIVSVGVTLRDRAAAGQRAAGPRLRHGQRGRHLDRGRQPAGTARRRCSASRRWS